ncbi:MAG: hypothetical protein ABJ327_20195 [Litoreibacter sp.]
MAQFSHTALWRAQFFIAKKERKTLNVTPLPTPVPDKIARDIGMSRSQVALHNYEWASQSTMAPRI